MSKLAFKIISILGLLLIGFGVIFIINNPMVKKKLAQNNQIESVTTGEARIGGDFSLINTEGKTVDSKNFQGKYMLVYFGFTHCPDICPAGLQVMSEVIENLGSLADKLQPIFITIDPLRDNKEQLKEYMESFNPNIIALTGNEEQISEVTGKYKVYHAKEEYDHAHHDHAEHEYMINHSSFTYLMDTEGKYVTHLPYGMQADEMVKVIKKYVK